MTGLGQMIGGQVKWSPSTISDVRSSQKNGSDTSIAPTNRSAYVAACETSLDARTPSLRSVRGLSLSDVCKRTHRIYRLVDS